MLKIERIALVSFWWANRVQGHSCFLGQFKIAPGSRFFMNLVCTLITDPSTPSCSSPSKGHVISYPLSFSRSDPVHDSHIVGISLACTTNQPCNEFQHLIRDWVR